MVLFPLSASRHSKGLCSFTFLLAAGPLLLSCNKESPGAAAEPLAPVIQRQTAAADSAPAQAPSPVAVAPAARGRVTEENFELVLSATGPFAAGKPGNASIVLDAKGPYKVNDKYPYKFKLKQVPGLTYSSLVVGPDQVKLEAKRATLPIAFTPEKTGKHGLSGQFAFSVCTDEKCLIERRDLAIDIEVQ